MTLGRKIKERRLEKVKHKQNMEKNSEQANHWFASGKKE